MGRLIDIDELNGCAIIRPKTHEDFDYIYACKNLISHNDIHTAYDIEAVVEQIEEFYPDVEHYGFSCAITDIIALVRNGGVK